ncbi:MAG: DUF3857 domain-containing protein [Fulvivirga sp.]
MMRKLLTIALVLVLTWAQGQEYQKYNWEEDRKITALSDDQKDLPFVYIKYHHQYEYTYEEGTGDLYLYQTEHQIIKVNNDNALARNNRIYIPMHSALELVDLQARTITKDGRTITFDKNDIKEINDEESGSGFKIFAIEGAEIGSEIEYYYTKKSYPSYFGREFYQFSEPLIDGTFLLLSPGNLEFEFKSYNGLTDINFDQAEGVNIYTLKTEDVAPLKKEEFSSYDNSRQRLEFKLSYNKASNRLLFKWKDAAQLLYDQVFIQDKEDEKLISKLISDIDLKKYNTERLKITAIEDYIKSNFYFDKNTGGQANELSFILENKIAGKIGMTKLLLNSIKSLGVDVQLVLTTSRNEIAFDGGFETYNYLEDYIIYLPKTDVYLAPYSPEFRYGMIPADLTATDGLFVTEQFVDDMPLPKAEIKTIPPLPAEDNLDKMEVGVTFNDDLTSNTITLKRSFNGYSSAFIKAVYPLIEEERKQELLKSLVKFLAVDADISTLAMAKTQFDFQTWDSPLVVDSQFDSPSFIELAGDIILFKTGELIGPQTELYQESERKTRVQNDFNREYDRTITVDIPDGYKIENLDDLIFEKKVVEGENEIYYFRSNYTLENRVLKIQVDEGYEEIYYPKEKFEAFREVINAAADWNKIVLVMSKS